MLVVLSISDYDWIVTIRYVQRPAYSFVPPAANAVNLPHLANTGA